MQTDRTWTFCTNKFIWASQSNSQFVNIYFLFRLQEINTWLTPLRVSLTPHCCLLKSKNLFLTNSVHCMKRGISGQGNTLDVQMPFTTWKCYIPTVPYIYLYIYLYGQNRSPLHAFQNDPYDLFDKQIICALPELVLSLSTRLARGPYLGKTYM